MSCRETKNCNVYEPYFKLDPITVCDIVSRVENIVTRWMHKQWHYQNQSSVVLESRERGLRHSFKHKEGFHLETTVL